MDASGLDRASHHHALDALARVNALSLTSGRVWTEVARLARGGVRPVRVLDVACGGGDVLGALARRARRHGIDVELHGCDLSPVALERARTRLGRTPSVVLHDRDVVTEALPDGFDLVCTSLFLHHLERPDAVRVLRAMADATRRILLVQDLRRTRAGRLLARLVLRVLTRSEVARHDGPVSVEAAFTTDEVADLCREAGLEGARVRRCWPQRLIMRWERR